MGKKKAKKAGRKSSGECCGGQVGKIRRHMIRHGHGKGCQPIIINITIGSGGECCHSHKCHCHDEECCTPKDECCTTDDSAES